jgi:multidrug efflux pump subunit AcrA (membrane-fusion protein)
MPGMFARVRILLYTKKDALVVPTDAVQGGEGEKWVYVVKLDDPGGAAMKAEEALPRGGLTGLAAMAMKKTQGTSEATQPEATSRKKEEGYVEKRPITVGYTRTDYTQIDAGITEGEVVVLTGFERLEDAKKVRLVETQEAEL